MAFSGWMGGREWIRTAAPLLVLAGGAAAFWFLMRQAPVVRHAAPEATAPVVETVPVAAHTGPLTLRVDGEVVPFVQVRLSAEVAGRVVSKADACRAGRFVRRGQELLRIDPRDYELQKRQLEEQLQQADVSLAEVDVEIANTEALIELAEQELALQEAELERRLNLLQTRAATPADVDQAKGSVLQARNALQTLKNQVELARTRRRRLESAKRLTAVELELAELNLERTKITAPLDGVVIEESVEVDSYVQRGAPLVTIEDTSAVEVRCLLRDDELAWIWRQRGVEAAATAAGYGLPETPAVVWLELAGHRYQWDGALWRYEGLGLDPQTRTAPCRVLVRHPSNFRMDGGPAPPGTGPPALLRGMFVHVDLHTRPAAPLLAIPEEALRPVDRVWLVREDRLRIRPVQVAEIREGRALLASHDGAVQLGDPVVISPLGEALEGMLVQARAAPPASPGPSSGEGGG